MGMEGLCKFVLVFSFIGLNVLLFALGTVLMSLAAWQWPSYVGSTAFFSAIFGESRLPLIFYMSGGTALMIISVVGIFAGLACLINRIRYLAATLLVVFTAVMFAIFTLLVIVLTLDFSYYFSIKGNEGPTINSAFVELLKTDGPFNSTAANWVSSVQTAGRCCGYTGGLQYEGTHTAMWHYWTYPSLYPNSTVYRPRSCCGALDETVSMVCNKWQPTYYWDGCGPAFVSLYQSISWSFLGLGIAAAVFGILASVTAKFLVGKVLAKCSKQEKE